MESIKNNLRVMKFGGTSVGDAVCIRRAAEIVAKASLDGRVVAVVSAMSGVTNQLVAAAHDSTTGKDSSEVAGILREQHLKVAATLIKNEDRLRGLVEEIEAITAELVRLYGGLTLLRELTPRTLAIVSSIGERLSARIVAAMLCERGGRRVALEAAGGSIHDD